MREHTVGGDVMGRRVAGYAVGLYLLFAVIGRFVGGMGAVQCGCAAECWCKRPILSTFRWVFPWGHRSPAGAERGREAITVAHLGLRWALKQWVALRRGEGRHGRPCTGFEQYPAGRGYQDQQQTESECPS
jgi:hypothetical protein